jgi:DNA-binding beta-propeller fold protein YncE
MDGTWLVSFHGGNDDVSINNLGVFNGSNSPASPFYALGPTPATQPHPGALPALRELRAFAPNQDRSLLYVVNAYQAFSQVLTFVPTLDGSHFAFQPALSDKKLSHPFALVVGWNDELYVSNQDGSHDAVVSITPGSGTVRTFPTENVEAPRGLAFDGTYLYLADASANTVAAYARSGSRKPAYRWSVSTPVHLMYDGARYLYIGSEKDNAVLVADTRNVSERPQPLVSGNVAGINRTAGLALVTDDNATGLYVCSRDGYQILTYPLTFSATGAPQWDGQTVGVFVGDQYLPDKPEFIAYVGAPNG